ncbi:subtilisin-like protease SBT4.14 [Carica papaya]|uniref:subtilisin-like protease SBT4.14 n=1 Tax=Carica papaya TaxID=3649 RepID=UPI000B8CA105|nr:subtilisin-like protease SBT4.14 [Carica papaya]
MAILLPSSPFLVYKLTILLIIFTTCIAAPVTPDDEEQSYIVYMGDIPKFKYNGLPTQNPALRSQLRLLSSVKGAGDSLKARESMLYSYSNSFNGFAARLTKKEAQALMENDQVVSVFPNRYHKLQTTRSWDFIDFPINTQRNLQVESDIIIGVLDSGINPDSDSFKDTNFGPIPAKWKGSCKQYANFTGCNDRKLIGATYIMTDGNPDPNDILSPVDMNGHGTHTASTAAGNLVEAASLYGLGKGIARGAVPSARIAAYKVCWQSTGCGDMDILAGFDQAIKDGVDIISISIGGSPGAGYTNDGIAIGAFYALKKGIITIASAGNGGPERFTVENHAPWILTVAASTIDRGFINKIQLGNGKLYTGVGISAFQPDKKSYPLVTGADTALRPKFRKAAEACDFSAVDKKKVKGKLVMCAGRWSVQAGIKLKGGVGTILEKNEKDYLDSAKIYMVPATTVENSTFQLIQNYMKSKKSATAVIHRTEEVKIQAPHVASFSSRGPNQISRRLLKPDITAPGADILAAYTPLATLTGLEGDTQYAKYTIMSGTSMATPHVAGIAAYIKSFHPDWSPAAIKSAIMTTAKPLNRTAHEDGELAYGAGQVNPRRAVDPGLIYDMNYITYIEFLCREGYEDSTIHKITAVQTVNCSNLIYDNNNDALNYPTFQLIANASQAQQVAIFQRAVTNVGPAISVYNATILAPPGVEVAIEPPSLSFTLVKQERIFTLKVTVTKAVSGEVLSGELVWISPNHSVRSPIVVYTLPEMEINSGVVETQMTTP